MTTKHTKLGTVLASGGKKLTVYLFEADSHGKSACAGSCARVWPPVLGAPKASGDAEKSQLGTIRRADGRTQVTYAGHPLYFYVKDNEDDDTYGQGIKSFGAEWYVLSAKGQKVEDASGGGSGGSGGGNGY